MVIRKRWLWWLGLPLLVLYMLMVFRPPQGGPPASEEDLPWRIEPVGDTIRVFGLTLGESTLGEAIDKLGRHELGIFRDAQGQLTLEAYFRNVRLGNLSARVVATARLPQERLQAMAERGGSGKRLASGVQQYSLAAEDQAVALATPVSTLTYVPIIDLTPEDVRLYFGEPTRRLPEPADPRFTHWLYPQRGLDLMLDPDGEAILQYLPPREFHRVLEPLLETPTPEETLTDG